MILKKRNVLLTAVFITGVSLFATSVFAQSSQKLPNTLKITIKQTNLVKESQIFLKDIARVKAGNYLREILEKIEIGRSPRPGEIKVFDKDRVISIIEHQQYLPENMIFTSPKKIYVKRKSQSISKKEIRQFVDQHLLKIFKGKNYKLTGFHVRGLEPYPDGKVKLQFDSSEIINDNGKLSAHINVIIDKRKEDRLNLSGSVALYENVFFAKKHLKRGELISKDGVYQEEQNIYRLTKGFIKSFEELDGKIIKSNIRKGECFKKKDLSDPPLIKKGDIVRLVVENDNLLIVTSGLSKENGFADEVIRVENMRSGRLVRGVVKARSEVEVVY